MCIKLVAGLIPTLPIDSVFFTWSLCSILNSLTNVSFVLSILMFDYKGMFEITIFISFTELC